jgi:hypothetical protein
MNFKTINDFNIAPTKLIQGPEKVIVTGRPISLVIISESQITNLKFGTRNAFLKPQRYATLNGPVPHGWGPFVRPSVVSSIIHPGLMEPHVRQRPLPSLSLERVVYALSTVQAPREARQAGVRLHPNQPFCSLLSRLKRVTSELKSKTKTYQIIIPEQTDMMRTSV